MNKDIQGEEHIYDYGDGNWNWDVRFGFVLLDGMNFVRNGMKIGMKWCRNHRSHFVRTGNGIRILYYPRVLRVMVIPMY